MNDTYAKKHRNTIAAELQKVNGDILLETIHIEFELRKSDFINCALRKGWLEASQIIVNFERDSILELFDGHLSPEAHCHI